MEDLSKPLEISSIEPTKIFRFLTSINQADKILFILEKYGVIRHSEIQRLNEMLPGITRKSTRTYYKNYKRLIDQKLIARIKEKTKEQQYYAYSITENGRLNLRKLLGINTVPSDVKDLAESVNTQRKSNDNGEARSIENVTRNKNQEIIQSNIGNVSNEISPTLSGPSTNDVMVKLTGVLEKIDHQLKILPENLKQISIQQFQSPSANTKIIRGMTKGFDPETESDFEGNNLDGDFDEFEDEQGENDTEIMDSEGNIDEEESNMYEQGILEHEQLKQQLEQERMKSHIVYLKSRTNTEIIKYLQESPNSESSTDLVKEIGKRENILEEKIRLYIRLKSIYIDNGEVRQELKEYLNINEPLSKFITYLSNCTSEIEKETVWEIIGPASEFDLTVKIEVFLKLVESKKIGYVYTRNLIRRLNLKANELNSIIESETHKIAQSLEIILYDIIASQLIANKSIEWEDLLDFTVKNEPKSKKGYIVFYLERAFLVGLYDRVLKIIENLKEQQQLTIAEAQIELLILLNLKKYDLLEKRIKEYDIFSDQYQNYDYYEELIFIAFRNYYEQSEQPEQSGDYPGKLTEILKKDSPFTKKWQKWRQIARLERDLKRMRIDEDWIDERDIQDILLKISITYQQVYQYTPDIDLAKFYEDSLLQDNILFYFAPHFCKWLNSLGGNGPRKAIFLLRKWWENKKTVIQHLSLQEEVLSLLKEWDTDNPKRWEKELEKLKKSRNIIIQNTHIQDLN
ncbi:hypothetical protein DSAG12_02566 [Promethearchaeum syntrophicum]|uniref:Uncharacterized protein n=1 Tax=Promethearchaeum syntrophicum TaxID=2594042 RepID=A0A5B9DDE7_9ARCH|nr:hypothetical protein [Candidatus Prometheoarchaeum syntrophicum]